MLEYPISKRFVRLEQGGTGFKDLPNGVSQQEMDKAEFQCVPTEAGTLVLIHGAVLHKSDHNRSEKSRFIYTFHMIEGEHEYPKDNWLQPSAAHPFMNLYETE